MKQKIKEALQQGYKNLGLKDEAFERVATSVETFITDESDIQKFVASELVSSLMKFEQADADRKRTKAQKEAAVEGDKAPAEGNAPQEATKSADNAVPAWAQQLMEQNKALAEQNKAFADKLNAFESAQNRKSAVSALEELVNTWDYAKGYPEESKYAKSLALGIYNGIGETWSAKELTDKYREIFNERVGEKGVDTGQPFKSEGESDGAFDSDYFANLYKGKIANSEN